MYMVAVYVGVVVRESVKPICTCFYTDKNFVLVHWPEEDCVSVVPVARVSGDQQVGSSCTVHIRGKTYTGQVAATGK